MTRPLNILHILRAPIGGLFRHVLDLALEQASRGHNVGILADTTSGDGLTETRLAGAAKHLRLGVHRAAMARRPSLADVSVIFQTSGLIDKLDIDVLHGHGAKGGLYARLGGLRIFGSTARGRAPKRFYTPHGGTMHFTDSFVLGLVYMGMETVLDRFSDGLIFESRFARQAFEEGLGRVSSETRIIANGLRPRDFDRIEVASSAAEFLFVGELRHLKGVDVLLRALARITGEGAPRLFIVGDGPDREAFKHLVSELGLIERVEFGGVMPADKAFSMGRVVVMPSRAESLPYIALEAAATGRPLIATRVGGVPEIVWGTDTELVAPGNVEALTAAMKNALLDIDNTEARAARLRRSVASRFTVASMTSSVLAFYEDAFSVDARASR